MVFQSGEKHPFYKHGLGKGASKNPIYNAWAQMLYWCRKKRRFYDKRWRKFLNFYADMAPSYYASPHDKNTCFLRRDKNLGYTKENCFWGYKRDQYAGSKKKKLYTFQGQTHTVRQWSKIMSINNRTLWKRLKNWSVEDALMLGIFPYRKTYAQHKVIQKALRSKPPEEKKDHHERTDGNYTKLLLDEVRKGRMTKADMKEALELYEQNRDRYNSASIQLAAQTNLKLRPKGINKKGYQFGINRQGI